MGNSSNKVAVASQISMLDSNHDWSTSLRSGSVMSKRQAISLVSKPILREVFLSSMLFSQKKRSNKIYDHGGTTIFGTSTSSGCFAMAPTWLASFFCFQTNRRLKAKSRSCLSLVWSLWGEHPRMEKQRKSEELANFMMENRVFGGVHVFFPQIQWDRSWSWLMTSDSVFFGGRMLQSPLLYFRFGTGMHGSWHFGKLAEVWQLFGLWWFMMSAMKTGPLVV